MIVAPGITVNGVPITSDQINSEVQYHPSENLPEAKYQAMQALVIRELLIQKAVYECLCSREDARKDPDDAIDRLLERDIRVPDPVREECERYYRNNRTKFRTSPLFEASHIFYPAPIDDEKARKGAYERAVAALVKIRQAPESFESIAHTESACHSAQTGGFLGQISAGQTLPAFEVALLQMREGDISEEPVETEVGYHIIRVHKRAEGRDLPEETALEWIEDYLKKKAWQRAFHQYVQVLAGQAKISGFRIKSSDTPLVQ